MTPATITVVQSRDNPLLKDLRRLVHFSTGDGRIWLADQRMVLVHAAAGMRGSAADMFANTVVGTRNLLDAAAAAA